MTPLAVSERSDWVEVRGAPIMVRSAGGGGRPPLLLLHGWGGSSRYWGGTMAALGAERATYAPDLPGFGASPPLAGEASAGRIAEMVLAIADRLGLGQFDLNGHSFCAGVAAHVAAMAPGRVRRLVLTCFSVFRDEAERRLVDQIHRVLALWMSLRQPWMGRRPAIYRAAAGRFFYRRPADDGLLRQSFADFLDMDAATALATAASAGDPAIITALRAVRCPALVIGARQDVVMPPPGTPAAAAHIPGGRLAWIERCGHLPMIERPDIYHGLLHAFLDEG